ncbi:hypothetical protein OSB04_008872 [Centaurea solstitialis]|uniref:Uncharacterized protein n=1 Tax=Centaurea solstitialis TaxID=347529 RepID=A0AA38U5X9_9ASTR|nr:hypothetical protein OSB04_008872 [Centaurea solstitialis]
MIDLDADETTTMVDVRAEKLLNRLREGSGIRIKLGILDVVTKFARTVTMLFIWCLIASTGLFAPSCRICFIKVCTLKNANAAPMFLFEAMPTDGFCLQAMAAVFAFSWLYFEFAPDDRIYKQPAY